jgi:ssDNA-binding Zn-finger/Zn-ribbon topoisomerase 1
MAKIACPNCSTTTGLVRFKRRGRNYVRCGNCRSERTDRDARNAANLQAGNVDEVSFGGDEPTLAITVDDVRDNPTVQTEENETPDSNGSTVWRLYK